MNEISALLRAVVNREEPSSWLGSLDNIRQERSTMMNLLESGEVVYGFSTRLGQFDHSPVADFEAELLKDHLVGNRFNLPGSFLRLVAAVKLAQLSCEKDRKSVV